MSDLHLATHSSSSRRRKESENAGAIHMAANAISRATLAFLAHIQNTQPSARIQLAKMAPDL